MVRQSSDMEANIVAVERIKEYTGTAREVTILLLPRRIVERGLQWSQLSTVKCPKNESSTVKNAIFLTSKYRQMSKPTLAVKCRRYL